MSDEALFSNENLTKTNWWKPTTPGDKCSGYLISRKTQPNTLKDKSGQTLQRVYELMDAEGNTTLVAGRYGNPQILQGLENVKLGVKVGVRYEKDNPPKTKGYNPTKVVITFADVNDMRPDLVRQEVAAPPVDKNPDISIG